jgi:DNA-binding NarL/FixJ family response regulator
MLQGLEQLRPRLRQVMDELLLGASEKQVAQRLQISPHTAHGYVKELYRRFGVCSRAELMARFVDRAVNRS